MASEKMRITYMVNPSCNLKSRALHILVDGLIDRFCSALAAFTDIILDFFGFCFERIRISRLNDVYGFISVAIGSTNKRGKTNLKWFSILVCSR